MNKLKCPKCSSENIDKTSIEMFGTCYHSTTATVHCKKCGCVFDIKVTV